MYKLLIFLAGILPVGARRLVFVGSYSTSIPIYELSDKGELTLLATVTEPHINSPSWLAIDSSNQFLYALSETDSNDGSGALSAFRIGKNGTALTFINEISSFGPFPCHLTIDKNRKYIFVSNYGGGSLASIAIASDGGLGELVQLVDHDAGEGAHVHESVLNEAASVMQVMDLGLNRVYQYQFDSNTGLLTSPADQSKAIIQFPDGSGPRHLLNHPYLNVTLVISELDSMLTCLVYSRESGFTGAMISSVSTLRADEDRTDMAAAEIQLSSDGQYVYTSNRDVSSPNKHRSSIAVFHITASTHSPCELSPLLQQTSSLGIHPRHFDLTYGETTDNAPLGQLMIAANRDSNNIAIFNTISETGSINQHGNVYTGSGLVAPTQILIVDI